jgi:hypothetical protein
MDLLRSHAASVGAIGFTIIVNVHFNLSGRLWSAPGKPEKCFTSLQAWRVERVNGAQQAAPSFNEDPFAGWGFDDEVPFKKAVV